MVRREYTPQEKILFEQSRRASDDELVEGGAEADPENRHHLLLTPEQIEQIKIHYEPSVQRAEDEVDAYATQIEADEREHAEITVEDLNRLADEVRGLFASVTEMAKDRLDGEALADARETADLWETLGPFVDSFNNTPDLSREQRLAAQTLLRFTVRFLERIKRRLETTKRT